MTTTFCTSGAAILKAGAGISGAAILGNWDSLINQAESYINVMTRYNYIDNFAGLNADVKLILEEAASNLAAIYAINYDYSGITTRIEAEDRINVLWARLQQCLSLLKDQQSDTYIKGA